MVELVHVRTILHCSGHGDVISSETNSTPLCRLTTDALLSALRVGPAYYATTCEGRANECQPPCMQPAPH